MLISLRSFIFFSFFGFILIIYLYSSRNKALEGQVKLQKSLQNFKRHHQIEIASLENRIIQRESTENLNSITSSNSINDKNLKLTPDINDTLSEDERNPDLNFHCM